MRLHNFLYGMYYLTLIPLKTTNPTFENSEDPDQMASEAIWSGSVWFVIEFSNLPEYIISINLIGWKS